MQASIVKARTSGGTYPKKLHTCSVLVLAFVTRSCVILYVLAYMPCGWFFTRGLEMRFLAESLLQGEGLSSPFGVPTGPTAMIAPGYPFFVALIFHLCGDATPQAAFVVMGLQMVLSVATDWIVIYLARSFVDERSALGAGAFWACSLPLIWMPTIFWETNISALLLIGFVAAAVFQLGSESRWLHWVVCGVALGIAALINPALAPSLMSLTVLAAYKGGGAYRSKSQSRAHVCIAFIVAGIVFSAWPVRNARVFHAFVATRTTYGLELWMGNRQSATGYLDERIFPMYNSAEMAEYMSRGEIGYAAEKSALAKEYIRLHPIRFIQSTAVRVGRFWFGSGTSNGSPFFILHAATTTVLGILGLFVLIRTKRSYEVMVFLVPLSLFPLPYYITHAEFRYRLVLDPIMTMLGAVAIASFKALSPNAKVSTFEE